MGKIVLCMIPVLLAVCTSTLETSSVAMREAAAQGCTSTGPYRLYSGDVLEVLCIKTDRERDAYELRPNDRLEIKFPSLEMYNSEQQILPNGTISLPRVKSLHIAGLTLDEAHGTIADAFAEADWQPEFFLIPVAIDQESRALVSLFRSDRGQTGKEVTVRSDGHISMPVLGEVFAAGKTLESLTRELDSLYSLRYPQIKVYALLRSSFGERVYVYGHVHNPGAFPIPRGISLAEALALAGGARDDAYLRQTCIVDAGAARRDSIPVRVVDARVGRGGPGPFTAAVCPGAVVYVPRQGVHSAAQLTRALSDIILFNGFSSGFQLRFD